MSGMLLKKLFTATRAYSPCMDTSTKGRDQRKDHNVKGCEKPYFGAGGFHGWLIGW